MADERIDGNLTVAGTLSVTELSQFTKDVEITNNLQINGSAFSFGSLSVTGPITAQKLEVNQQVKSGPLTIGPWPANPDRYVHFGTDALNQGAAGNYALLQGSGAERGRTFLNSPVDIRFRINNGDRMILANNGNVGIGTTKPAAPLHVAQHVAVGPFSATGGQGGIDVTGPVAELGFVRRTLKSWPANPQAGDRFVWYNPDGTARLWTQRNRDLLTIDSNGNVGIGTTKPKAPLHVSQYIAVGPFSATGGQGGIDVTGPVAELGFVKRTLKSWPSQPQAGDRFVWYNPNGTARLWTQRNRDLMTVHVDSGISLKGGAQCTSGRTWRNASSIEYKESVAALSIHNAQQALQELQPVTFKYRGDDEQQVGFIAEEVPDLVATKDRKTLSPMDIVAVLTRVVQQQQREIRELRSDLDSALR